MKIAFDVKGTLSGPKEKFVVRLLLELQALGHECIVWSNSFGYAVDCVAKNGFKEVRAESKSTKWDRDQSNWYDVAIEDDHSQDYLAAKRIIFVDDPAYFGAMGGVMKLVKEIGESK